MPDNPSYETLCIGCMESHAGPGPCPHCGLDKAGYETPPHHLQPRSILAGKYLVGKALGEGGFGITYIGFDLNLELRVAIKEYFPSGLVTRQTTNANRSVTPFMGESGELYQKGIERFLQEAKSLAKFYELPGIVSVKDFFRENGTAYIVMEFLEGVTLKRMLADRGGRIPFEETMSLLGPVLESLSKVHAEGLIHRDISPDNIMLTQRGAKLIDFGAAREFAAPESRSRSVVFKVGFAPWEQYQTRGEQGPWTDVYALCATIYRCVTGETPPEALERIGEDLLEPPSRKGAVLPASAESALMRGLAVFKKDRYADIPQLTAALQGRGAEEAPAPLPRIVPPAPAGRKKLPATVWLSGVGLAVAILIFALINGQGRGTVASPGASAPTFAGITPVTTAAPVYTPAAAATLIPAPTASAIPTAAPTTAAPSVLAAAGNTAGNCVNAGLGVEYKGFIYYANRGDSYRIHRMDAEGANDTAINDTNSWGLNIVDDTIYFLSDKDGNCICSMSVDGGPYRKLNSSQSDELCVVDGYIYYRNRADHNRPYRMKPDGSGQERLYDEPVEYINVEGGYLYFAATDNGGAVTKVNLDDSSANTLTDPENDGGYLNVLDGRMYFCSDMSNGMPVRYGTDGKFDSSAGWDEYELSAYLNASPDGWLYFYCYKDSNGTPGIYKTRLDGSDAKQVAEANDVWNINVAGDWIFYRVNKNSGSQTMYRVRTDGSGKQLVG